MQITTHSNQPIDHIDTSASLSLERGVCHCFQVVSSQAAPSG